MTAVKLLFVLALAVPLMVFMGYYIVNLQKEFFKNVKEQQSQAHKDSHSDVDEKRVWQRSYRETYGDKVYREDTRRQSRVNGSENAYDSKRAKFDNSDMKRRYEQSIAEKRRMSEWKPDEEAANHRNRNTKKAKVKNKSKRKRRKELRNKRKA